MKSEWHSLRKQLEQLGYIFRHSGKGHWKVYDGNRLVTVMPNSTSDIRALRNQKAHLKRTLGIVLT